VPPYKRARVLVVDDDPNQRYLFASLLEHEGYRVTTADGGLQALQRIAAEPPDILILDLLMPVVDGFDVLAEIRLHTRQTQVIVITGDPDSKARLAGNQACAVLSKPVQAAVLVSTVAGLATLVAPPAK
jgi:CheY-like chemotaxis protein